MLIRARQIGRAFGCAVFGVAVAAGVTQGQVRAVNQGRAAGGHEVHQLQRQAVRFERLDRAAHVVRNARAKVEQLKRRTRVVEQVIVRAELDVAQLRAVTGPHANLALSSPAAFRLEARYSCGREVRQ
ncbi:MAG: hypothetical protein LBU72_02465 [Burkholderiaceae bacterium]|nr:hypothetical protein [Burkholderiaceae bacterium]